MKRINLLPVKELIRFTRFGTSIVASIADTTSQPCYQKGASGSGLAAQGRQFVANQPELSPQVVDVVP